MKSSHRSWIPSSINSPSTNWLPEEFEQTTPQQDLELAEKIISLFMPDHVDIGSTPRNKFTGGLVNLPTVPDWYPMELDVVQEMTVDSPIQEFTILGQIKDHVQKEPEPLPEELLEAKQKAEQILADARNLAEEIIREAQQKRKEIEESAFAEAFQKGLLYGEDEGFRKATEETKQQLDLVHEIVNQFQQWKANMLAQSETAVLGVIRDMAKAMFGNGFDLDQATLENTFNLIMENTRSLGALKVYINPEDAMILNPYWRETQVAISGQQIQLIPSDAIQRGGCFVDGEFGSLDARIETQLKTLLNTIDMVQQQVN